MLHQIVFISLLIGGLAMGQKQHKDHKPSSHSFDNAEEWAHKFEDPSRDEWQQPEKVLAIMAIPENATIADIGSATGYFPVRFAKAAPKGIVYGIDIEKDMIDFLNKRAEKENLPNLKSFLGELDDSKIPGKMDYVFICNTYHHIQNRNQYFSKLIEKLNPGGQLVIVDFRKGDLPVGPSDDHKLPMKTVIGELTKSGYHLIRQYDELPYQYLLIFKVKPS